MDGLRPKSRAILEIQRPLDVDVSRARLEKRYGGENATNLTMF